VRKELKVRPGFTPEEDKARYRTTGARESSRLRGYVPGATSQSSTSYQAPDLASQGQFPSLTAAQKKNQKRRDKKKLEKEQEDARNWDSDEEEAGDQAQDEVAESSVTDTDAAVQAENADAKEALRHLIQQSVTSNPAPVIRPNSRPVTPPTPVEKPYVPKEKKGPRPGGLLGAALKVATVRDTPSEAGEKPSVASLSQEVQRLEISKPTSKETSPIKPEIRPGGGLYKDLGIKPKSESSSKTVPTSQPPRAPRPLGKPLPPGAGSGGASSNTKNAKAAAQPAKTRTEPRVRPGHGLAGMLRQISEQNAK
jgi:partner of Y14 and mago protein